MFHPNPSKVLRRRRKIIKKSEDFLQNESFLSDDLLIDILSWLPAKDVLRFRCVCSRWRDLTSIKGFTDLHTLRSFPMILKEFEKGEVLLDRCWQPAQTRSKIYKVYEPDHRGIILSNNGLIVAGRFHNRSFIIYNPIYLDVVKITMPSLPYECKVFGVFFHPVQKEYCILLQKVVSLNPSRLQYKIINLEFEPKCRDIKNPPPRNLQCKSGIHPLFIEKCLYWMVYDSTLNCHIMEYDIVKEEFTVVPGPVCLKVVYDKNVNLIDFNGVVSIVQAFPSKESIEINIWTLKVDGEQLWACSNYIISFDVNLRNGLCKPIALWNEELVIFSYERFYICNYVLGTYRKFGQKHNNYVKYLPHVISLASLRNCMSEICIVEEDENNQP